MHGNDRLDDGKPEPRTFVFPRQGIGDLRERLLDPLQMLGVDSNTAVADTNFQFATI